MTRIGSSTGRCKAGPSREGTFTEFRMERAGPGDSDHVEVPGPIQMITSRARFARCPILSGALDRESAQGAQEAPCRRIARTES